MIKPATIDFETEEIKKRPHYPPKPVGVAIIEPGKKPKYMAWGHPCENNCTKAAAVKELKRLYKKYPILCHHGKFDLDVAETHLKLKFPKEFHDTEFLAFLNNPHEVKLKLKDLANTYLDMPPDEQLELRAWIMAHVPEAKGKSKTWKDWGAYISRAPGKLVGKYAIGDVVRTEGLFKLWYKDVVVRREMAEAYNRELDLMPVLLESERHGIPIAERKLKKAVKEWESWLVEIDNYLRKKLKVKDPEILMKGDGLADALEAAEFIGEWIYTAPSTRHPNGQRSTSKDNIILAVNNKDIVNALLYRSKLANALQTFGRPWLAMAATSGGLIYTNWNQVRGDGSGARTGRLSSNPNFQAIPKKPEPMPLPRVLANKVGLLPAMRDFIIPHKGFALLNRDYSQQELRILGHFEDNVLLKAYNKNPKLDLHDHAVMLINKMLRTNFPRKPIKNMGFGLIYGMGIKLLAATMGVDVKTAKILKKAYLEIFPGLKDLDDDLKSRGKFGESIRTWGNRQYYVEESKVIKGRLRTYEYKLLNVLIQGSAADCTKQAMINYDKIKQHGHLLLNVHDEIMLETPLGTEKTEMALLKQAMESVEFDVPMLSDGKASKVSWGKLKKQFALP